MLFLIRFLLPAAFASALSGAAPTTERMRGGQVEWARLKTESRYWNRHAERDAHVLSLMRSQTSLDIAETYQSASAGSLEELCAHPFLFAESVAPLSQAEGAAVAEYLRRGGFLLIDACVSVAINPNAEAYLADQVTVLSRHLPKLRVVVLEPEHEVFSIYFKLSRFPPQTRSGSNPKWANGSTEPLRALYLGQRMVGVISLSGFQCGLVQNSSPTDVIRMVTNIYIYAMTR